MCHILRCLSLQKQREKSFFAAFCLAFTKSPTSLDKTLILWYNTLVPMGLTLEGCGELIYVATDTPDTEVVFSDGAFRFVHNAYAYEIPVTGCGVEETEEGYRLVPTGAVKLDMSKR